MTCQIQASLLRSAQDPSATEARAALQKHAEHCPDCETALALMRSATLALRTPAPRPDSDATRRMWGHIQKETRSGADAAAPRDWTWRWALILAPAVVLVLWLSVRPTPPAPTPAQVEIVSKTPKASDPKPPSTTARVLSSGRNVVKAGRFARFHQARVEARAGDAVVLVEPPGAEARTLYLEHGAARFVVRPLEPEQTMVIRTPDARIEVVGTVFSVAVDYEQTTVEVEEGTVRVWEPRKPPRLLEAGARHIARPAPQKNSRVSKILKRAQRPTSKARLAQAKRALFKEPKRAGDIAQAVLDQRPAPLDEVEALAVLADAHRRRGRHAEASKFYARVYEHPQGGAYAEEAMLRGARALVMTSKQKDALALLQRAQTRFGAGALHPERADLTARLHLALGRPKSAARALLSTKARTPALKRTVRKVASELQPIDPALAQNLLSLIQKK